MGDLLGTLAQNLVSWLVGEAIDAAGEQRSRPYFRIVGVMLVAAISGWIAIASLWLWTSEHYPGVKGLLVLVVRGGPGWLLAAPALAVVTLVLVLLPGSGMFSLAAAASAASCGCVLAALAAFQGGGSNALNAAAISSGITGILLPLLGLMLAMNDIPSLDSPLARVSLVYWGRLRHLRALREWGIRHRCTIHGPVGSDVALRLQGMYDSSHQVTVTSGANFRLSTANNMAYSLSIRMGSPRDIVSFRISREPAPKKARSRAVGSMIQVKHGRKLYYYVVPNPAYPLPDGFIEQLGRIVARGAHYFGARDFARATPFGIRYTHMAGTHLTVQDANLDTLIVWMHELIRLLEQISPAGPSEAASQLYRQPAGWEQYSG